MEMILSKPLREQRAVSDGIIGMIFLLATEAMFFAGLISAYIVNRAGIPVWPPEGQPRLPVAVTAVNTTVLILSGILLFLFKRNFKSTNGTRKNSLRLLAVSIALGGTFLVIQGTEWMKLIHYGLTTTSSLYGGFFYLIIGAHSVHAIAGLATLIHLLITLKREPGFEFANNKITVSSMYWSFVVGIWPILYLLVYLI